MTLEQLIELERDPLSGIECQCDECPTKYEVVLRNAAPALLEFVSECKQEIADATTEDGHFLRVAFDADSLLHCFDSLSAALEKIEVPK